MVFHEMVFLAFLHFPGDPDRIHHFFYVLLRMYQRFITHRTSRTANEYITANPRTDTRRDTGSDPVSLPLPPGNLPRDRTPGTGSLVIWSSPPACSVYIDGMYAGDTPTGPDSFTTPVKSGPHIVKITKIGYEDYTQNVVISGGGPDTITATLSEKPFPYYTLHPTSPVTGSVY